jgi:hypothetical protein
MASKTVLKTNTLTVTIFIELILWITLSTIFGYLVGDHWYHLGAPAIVAFVFATLTTLAMLGLEVYGMSKKHMESMNACIVIRSVRCMIFLCIAVAVGQDYYNQGLVTIFIICMLWDLMRIKSEVKIISLIKKENSQSTKGQAGMDAEAQLESDQSMELSFPKIIKSFFTEKINEMNLLKNENSEDRNTEALTKKENNGSISNKVLIQNEIIFFILFCTVFVLVIHEIEWGAFTDIVLYVLTILTTLVIWSLEAYGSSTKQLKHTKSMIACRSIRCLFFILLLGCNFYYRFYYGFYYSRISDIVSSILIAFCIAFILCDLLRIKSYIKMINLIAKENNNEKPTLTKTALKFDYDNHDKVQFESLEPTVSRIKTLVLVPLLLFSSLTKLVILETVGSKDSN